MLPGLNGQGCHQPGRCRMGSHRPTFSAEPQHQVKKIGIVQLGRYLGDSDEVCLQRHAERMVRRGVAACIRAHTHVQSLKWERRAGCRAKGNQASERAGAVLTSGLLPTTPLPPLPPLAFASCVVVAAGRARILTTPSLAFDTCVPSSSPHLLTH